MRLKHRLLYICLMPFLTLSQANDELESAQSVVSDAMKADLAKAKETVEDHMESELSKAKAVEACIPPGAASVVKATDDDNTPINEQPRLGCAVILCLAAPSRPGECNPVMNALYSAKWLAHLPPKFPNCSDDDTGTTSKRITDKIKVRGNPRCILTAKRMKVDFHDLSLLNLQKKLGLPVDENSNGQLIYSVKLPYKYRINWRGKDEDNIDCPVTSWKAHDYRNEMPEDENKKTEEEILSSLDNLPVCEEEVPKPCINSADSEAISANAKLPEEEQAEICELECYTQAEYENMSPAEQKIAAEQRTVCGQCEVTVSFIEKIFGRPKWLSASNLRKYPIYKTDASVFIKHLNNAMSHYGIKSCIQKAHFVTQSYFETDRYKTMKEYAPFAGTYRGGQKYHGRGAMQLTHNYNYKKYGLKFHRQPELLLNHIKDSTMSAGFFWRKSGAISKKHNARGDINKLIAAEPFNSDLITVAVHGGHSQASVKARRRKIFERIVELWGIKK